MSQPKFIVGIDLGTTNIVVTSAPLTAVEDEKPEIRIFPVLQEFAQGTLEEKEFLPSFLFERLQEKQVLPWKRETAHIAGGFARERGAEVPGRLISSTKSWLCNPLVDRREAILPWNAAPDAKKLSPLDAQAEFLTHVRLAWNQKNKAKLEDQIVIVTIPASFDAAARDLTVEAARAAGLPTIVLLEEPQAAFYSWIAQTDAPWREQVKKGDVVLVVDVGGGTSDFSLIEIGEEGGDLTLKRVAVGNHILLGGDNMDLTLSFHLKKKLEAAKKRVDNWQMLALTHACRKAKERLLSEPDLKSEPIVISGRGSSVVGGSIKTTLERGDIETILMEGFFPPCKMEEPTHEEPATGFRELNLAYAADPAVTRHLAKFLRSQGSGGQSCFPKAILFNGGVFLAEPFRNRLIEVINSWLSEAGQSEIRTLKGADLSRAVAIGATSYGLARQGKGIRIRGGVSQAYYLGIESSLPAVPGMERPLKALCVAQIGMEEGTVAQIPQQRFGLIVGKTVEFKFFKSNCRRDDKVGQLFEEVPDQVEATSGLSINLPVGEGMSAGDLVEVGLEVGITEIGTLEIWCHEKTGAHRWKLEFNVREAIK